MNCLFFYVVLCGIPSLFNGLRCVAFRSISFKVVITRQNCIGTTVSPVNESVEPETVMTNTENSIPIIKSNLNVRPELITFDAYDTLIAPSQSIGRWYRAALNSACNMSIRLPRPELFQKSFHTVYGEMRTKHPCFGKSSGLTSRDWWWQVVEATYLRTQHNTALEPEEFAQVLPAVFDMLYKDIFGTQKGWVVKEDVVYTLSKLQQWRDVGAGPQLAVISNCDERLHNILKELDLLQYFNMVLTSAECGIAKPDPHIFHLAAQRAGKMTGSTGALSPGVCIHVGNSVEHDVCGAAAAGWTALRYHEWFDEDFPGWAAAEGECDTDSASEEQQARVQAEYSKVLRWGRRSLDRTVSLADGSTAPLEWYEMWALEDVLTLCGLPADPDKTYRTTVLKGVYDDNN